MYSCFHNVLLLVIRLFSGRAKKLKSSSFSLPRLHCSTLKYAARSFDKSCFLATWYFSCGLFNGKKELPQNVCDVLVVTSCLTDYCFILQWLGETGYSLYCSDFPFFLVMVMHFEDLLFNPFVREFAFTPP